MRPFCTMQSKENSFALRVSALFFCLTLAFTAQTAQLDNIGRACLCIAVSADSCGELTRSALQGQQTLTTGSSSPSQTPDSMTSLLVRLAVPLLLLFLLAWPLAVLGQEGEESEEQEQHICDVQCTPYVSWADECVVSDCSGLQQEAGVACVRDCQEGAELCQQLCRQHRHLLLETCKDKCQDASIMDIFCDEECFHQQFDSRFATQLPDVSPQEQGSSSSDSDDDSGSVEDDHDDKDEDDDVEDEDDDVEDKDDDEDFYQYFDELPEDQSKH